MKKVTSLLFVFFLVSFFAFDSIGQERKKIDLKSEAVKDKTKITEIKKERGATDEEKIATRGAGAGTCILYLHNYTGYTIDIYVDGYYEGTLGAYDDSWVTTGTGYTTVYGISIGRTKSWNFKGASCYDYYDYNFYN